MKNKKTLLFSLGFLLLLAIVSGTSYQLLVNKEAKENTAATNVKNDDKKDDKDDSKPVASYVVEETTPDTVEKINVNDVTTYSDPELGLSFSYPKSLKVKNGKTDNSKWVSLENSNFDVQIEKQDGNSSTEGLTFKQNSEVIQINGREYVFPKDFYKNKEGGTSIETIGLVFEKYPVDSVFLAKSYDPFTINDKTYRIFIKIKTSGDNEETKKFFINLISSINF